MSDDLLSITVECHAGYRGEQTPRAFWLGERRIEVAEVVDCWLAPEHRYFKVTGADAHTYILRHEVEQDRWELTMFQA
jgi:hypothetical protein